MILCTDLQAVPARSSLVEFPALFNLYVVRVTGLDRNDDKRYAEYAKMINEDERWIRGAASGEYLPTDKIMLDMELKIVDVEFGYRYE